MSVVECGVPAESALGKNLIERASFRDAYRAPLGYSDLGVVEIFHGVFAHRPAWMNVILIARNKAAALIGLEVPTNSEILDAERRDTYAVGEKIGPWPIFFLGEDELIAGRDNTQMDFRLSIMKTSECGESSAIISTICIVKNRLGRHYLSSIYSISQIRRPQADHERGCCRANLVCKYSSWTAILIAVG